MRRRIKCIDLSPNNIIVSFTVIMNDGVVKDGLFANVYSFEELMSFIFASFNKEWELLLRGYSSSINHQDISSVKITGLSMVGTNEDKHSARISFQEKSGYHNSHIELNIDDVNVVLNDSIKEKLTKLDSIMKIINE